MHGINNSPHAPGPGELRATSDGQSMGVGITDNRPASSHSASSPRLPSATAVTSSTPSHPPQPPPPSSSASLPVRLSAPGVVLRSPPSKHPPPSTSTRSASLSTSRTPTRKPIGFSFPLFFAANNAPSSTSSTSLVPSTAEGKPITLDDGTAALRELSAHFPSPVYRHRYAKSTGAQSATYSQPVIVRTYSGPRGYDSRTPSGSRPVNYNRRPLPSSTSATASTANGGKTNGGASTGSTAANGGATGSRNGVVNGQWTSNNIMPRPPPPPPSQPATKKRSRLPLTLPWHWGSGSGQDGGTARGESSNQTQHVEYPPLEAFTVKGIIQARLGQSELGTDLDRIAELYAKNMYSLSSHYDVHVKPHGSGADFMPPGAAVGAPPAPSASGTAGGTMTGGGNGPGGGTGRRGGTTSHRHRHRGPTLQATWSEDDASDSAAVRGHRKQRSGGGGRRKSVAYGTLETIMSSSRSSEEDKTKKKSAEELTEAVRGRAERAAARGAHGGQRGRGESDSQPQQQPEGNNSASAQYHYHRRHRQRGSASGGAASGQQAGPASASNNAATNSATNYGTDAAASAAPEITPAPPMTGSGGRHSPRPRRHRGYPGNDTEGKRDRKDTNLGNDVSRKKSTAFAQAVIMDSSRHHHHTGSGNGPNDDSETSPRSSAAALLVSEPALPQTFVGQLDAQATSMASADEHSGQGNGRRATPRYDAYDAYDAHDAYDAAHRPHRPASALALGGGGQPQHQHTADNPRGGGGLLAGLNGWIPWRGGGPPPSVAEGSLRDLLKTVDGRAAKGKGVDRSPVRPG